MFTGIIESICKVKSVRRDSNSMRITVELGSLAEEVKISDSIAINGICLTVSELDGLAAVFDVSSETISRTKSTLGVLKASSHVNVERAIEGMGRFGGHFVTGHVDGTAIIKSIERHGDFASIKFAAEGELLDAMVIKGSVAVDGISLTISEMDKESFSVAVIPETLKRTTLGEARSGDSVNIETDIIVKTINKQLEKILPRQGRLSVEQLKELGF